MSDPERIHLWGRQAVALHQQGRRDEAEVLYRRLMAEIPHSFAPLYFLGTLKLEQQDFAQAADLIGRALAIDPSDGQAWSYYGLALHGQMRFAEALAAQDKALAIAPGLLLARACRGAALRALGRHQAALADYEAVLAADPGNADAWNGRGALLRSLGRIDEALASLNKAVELAPDFAEALQNRGLLLWDEKTDYPAALADLKAAVAREPTRPSLASNLLHLRIMMALKDCAWAEADAIAATLPDLVAAGEGVPPMMLLSLDGDETLQLQAARTLVAQRYPELAPLCRGPAYRHQPIRLAYISSDLGEHPVGAQIAQLIGCHDRSRFEVQAISTGPHDGSALRQRLANSFDHFHDHWGSSAEEIADHIHRLEVDVLVDLNGHTQRGSFDILRRRPAPVQVGWLGFAGTSGAPFIDYLIADRIVAPHPQAFSEKLQYLPHSFFVTDTSRPVRAGIGRLEAGLPQKGFVFCGFHHVMKLRSQSFAQWMRILGKVPQSVLWLRDVGDTAKHNLRAAAFSQGIDPERLIFAARVPADVHLGRHAAADLFLDTLPYNGHATACDALWAGLPVLTCQGTCFAGRVAASLLHAVGLQDLITQTAQEYEELAIALAQDPQRLARIRGRLADNRGTAPLFDTKGFARDIEAIYERLCAPALAV